MAKDWECLPSMSRHRSRMLLTRVLLLNLILILVLTGRLILLGKNNPWLTCVLLCVHHMTWTHRIKSQSCRRDISRHSVPTYRERERVEVWHCIRSVIRSACLAIGNKCLRKDTLCDRAEEECCKHHVFEETSKIWCSFRTFINEKFLLKHEESFWNILQVKSVKSARTSFVWENFCYIHITLHTQQETYTYTYNVQVMQRYVKYY